MGRQLVQSDQKPQTTFDFTEAVRQMHAGNRVKRLGWMRVVLYLEFRLRQGQKPFATLVCYDHHSGGERRSPWQPYFTDFMATDWVVV